MSTLAALLALVICDAPLEPPPSRANVISVDLFLLTALGDVTFRYERATSPHVALAVTGGYRFGGPGTTIGTMSISADYEARFGTAVRIYPLGRAPRQLFLSPGIEAQVGRELTGGEQDYHLHVNTYATLTAGWSWHFFDRWTLTPQTGVVFRWFATFRNIDLPSWSSSSPIGIYLSLATGVAF
jgi:hypothetical protein